MRGGGGDEKRAAALEEVVRPLEGAHEAAGVSQCGSCRMTEIISKSNDGETTAVINVFIYIV